MNKGKVTDREEGCYTIYMSKKIIIYYSFEGNTKFIADYLAQKIDAEILMLKPEKEIGTHGFMKYFWGGQQAIMKKTPRLEKYIFKEKSYDTVIFGSPVWAGTFAPALRSFLKENKIKGKKTAFFCCHEGGKGKVLEATEKLLSDGNDYLGAVDIKAPLTNEEFSFTLLNEWIETLI